MNNVFEKEFDFILEKTKTLSKPMRVVVAGADAEHLLQAVFEAEAQGFAIPVLVGDEARIQGMLKSLNLENRKYEICGSSHEDNIVQDAIDVVRNGGGDVLMRGNTSTRGFLMPLLNKSNKLIEKDVLTYVSLMKIPHYDRLLALSDAAVIVNPSIERRKLIIRNMVEMLNKLGINHPNVAVLSLVEKPSFHMRDTVEAQTIARDHAANPIADCEVVGPITWDLVVSKEAARLKGYDNPLCGEFDAVCVPDVMAGNILVKALMMSAHVNSCGIVAGATVPIALNSRSNSVEQAFLSLATCAALLQAKK